MLAYTLSAASRKAVRRGLGLAGALLFAGIAGCQLILGLDDWRFPCLPDDNPCVPCVTPADCGFEDACRWFACVDNVCRVRYLSAGTPCPAGVCDYNARCVECFMDTDCGDAAYCKNNHCEPLRCDDGVLNGDEWKVDCGGHCPLCQSEPCVSSIECRSGFCSDGRCCDIACADICTWCDVSGTCVYVPQQYDDYPDCHGLLTCNGGGVCAKRNGEPCVSEAECASLKCDGTKCVP